MSAWTTPKTWAYKESLASNDMNTYVKDNLSYLKDTVDALLPTGIMWIWPTDTAPTGFLLCRGQAISRTTYATLFAIIGTNYGVGDNSTTFNLPNGAGKVFVGKDSTQTEFDALGEVGGDKVSSALIAHTHTGPSHTHTGATGTESADHVHSGTTGTVSSDHSHTFSGTTQGQSATHNHSTNYSDGGPDIYQQSTGLYGPNITNQTPTTNASNDHTHTYSGTTSGISANHTHNFTTGGRNAAHTHSFTSDAAGTGNTGSAGSGASYSIMNPYQVINFIIKY